MARFQDNVTRLDAATLNEFEEDLKRLRNGLPVFNATFDSADESFYRYKIDDPDFDKMVKIGFTFIMIPSVSSKGDTGAILAIRQGFYGNPLFWNNTNKMPNIGYEGYARVNNDKYLEANKPYIIKCFAKVSSNFQFIISEMFQDVPASQNEFGGVKVWVEGSTLNVSTK